MFWGKFGGGQQTAPKSFFWEVNLDETGYRETYAGISEKRVLKSCFRARAAALQVEYIVAILTGAINPQYLLQYLQSWRAVLQHLLSHRGERAAGISQRMGLTITT